MSNSKKKKTDKEKKALTAITVITVVVGIPLFVLFLSRYFKNNTGISTDTPVIQSPIATYQQTEIPAETVAPTQTVMPTETAAVQTPEPVPSSSINLNEIEIRNMTSLKIYLESILKSEQGKHGLSLYNTVTEEYIGINDTELFVAASSTKVPMVMYVYNAVEKEQLSFDDIVVYTENDYEEGTGIIIKGEFGDVYTIGELAEYAIIHSDNCAINMLIRTCNEWYMVNYMNKLGAKVDYIRKRWKTCPYDLTLYYKELLRLVEVNPEHYQKLMDDLCSNKVGYWMSSKSVLPEDLQIAMKTGINTTLPTYNEATIVFTKHPYILSYCSTDIVIEESTELHKKISKVIYDFMENGYAVGELKWK